MVEKRSTAQEKLDLVIESLKGDVDTSEHCRKHDIWPTDLDRFKQKALEGALEALNSSRGKTAKKEALKGNVAKTLRKIYTQT